MMAEIVACRRRPQARAADLPHRYARRARILQERRHPAVRAAPSRGLSTIRKSGWRVSRFNLIGTRSGGSHSPRSEWRVIARLTMNRTGGLGARPMSRGGGRKVMVRRLPRSCWRCSACSCHRGAIRLRAPSRARVVELFTSQGCSSCPAADKLLGEFAHDPSLVAHQPADRLLGLSRLEGHAAPIRATPARQKAYAQVRGDRAGLHAADRGQRRRARARQRQGRDRARDQADARQNGATLLAAGDARRRGRPRERQRARRRASRRAAARGLAVPALQASRSRSAAARTAAARSPITTWCAAGSSSAIGPARPNRGAVPLQAIRRRWHRQRRGAGAGRHGSSKPRASCSAPRSPSSTTIRLTRQPIALQSDGKKKGRR